MTVLVDQPDLIYNGKEYWWLQSARDGQGAFVDKENFLLTDDEYKAYLAELKIRREGGEIVGSEGVIENTYSARNFKDTDVVIDNRVYNSVEIIDMGCSNIIPQHTLDEQYQISDHIIEQAPKFILTINASLENGEYEALRVLEKKKTFFEVTLPFGHYKNMVLESIKFQSSRSINRVQTTLTVKEIRVGQIRIMTSPSLIIQQKAEDAIKEENYLRGITVVKNDEDDPYNQSGDATLNEVNGKLKLEKDIDSVGAAFTMAEYDPATTIQYINYTTMNNPRVHDTKFSVMGVGIVTGDMIEPMQMKRNDKPHKLVFEGEPWRYTVGVARQTVEDERLIPTQEAE